MLKEYKERAEQLYNYMDHDPQYIEEDCEHDYLTNNTGRDGRDYLWYLDENKSVAIDILTGEIIDDETKIDELFV